MQNADCKMQNVTAASAFCILHFAFGVTGRIRPVTATPFTPPWWLSTPHAQTVWPRLARSRRLVTFRRESLEMPDGDELILDHVDAQPPPPALSPPPPPHPGARCLSPRGPRDAGRRRADSRSCRR